MRTRYKTNADYGMLKSDEEKTRERCLKGSAEDSIPKAAVLELIKEMGGCDARENDRREIS